MAKITVNWGSGASSLADRELWKYSDELKTKMLKAGGDVVAKYQRQGAEDVGLRDTGFLIESIQARTDKTHLKLTEDGGSIEIAADAEYPLRSVGKGGKVRRHKPKTNAAMVANFYDRGIAGIEYGSSSFPARPFVRRANSLSVHEAIAAVDAVRKAAGEGE